MTPVANPTGVFRLYTNTIAMCRYRFTSFRFGNFEFHKTPQAALTLTLDFDSKLGDDLTTISTSRPKAFRYLNNRSIE